MSTLQVVNAKHPSSASNNLVLDNAGNATFAGTAAMASSFLRNRIINGDFRIAQRGTSFTGQTSDFYGPDRWTFSLNSTGIYSVAQSTVVPNGTFTNSCLLTVTTSKSPASADVYGFRQRVEGFNSADFAWGTANAQTVTLSFWVRSSIAGVYTVSMFNNGFVRAYVSTYTIASANTWQYVTLTVPGDTSGTWLTNNGIGMEVYWDLGSGSNFNTTAGAWGSGAVRTSGSTNWISTNGATFYITGVQLEVGSVVTPFERRQYGTELMLCQRYYETGYNIWSGYTNGVSPYYFVSTYKVTKRASASLSFSGITNSGFPNTAPTVGVSTEQLFRADPISNASSTAGFYQFNWTASAEL